MPEGPELKIMADYINVNAKEKKFNKIYDVAKGNIPTEFMLADGDFSLVSVSNGKELLLNVYHDVASFKISVFMGMSGNWLWIPTKDWTDRKFVRMRMDTTDGWSLLLYGLYMGPKYKVGGFTTKRGPDPTKEFDAFKNNVLDNLGCKAFDKPLGESLLNQKYFNGLGAYLFAEIVGRLDFNPHLTLNQLSRNQLEELFDMIVSCFEESYSFGGGEIKDWQNPFGENRIDEWLNFYGNKEECHRHMFGKRNLWIKNKYKTTGKKN